MRDEETGKQYFRTHEDLAIYQLAFETAMKIFEHSQKFPVEEKYSLTDQIVVLLVQCVLIWHKLGEKEDIEPLLSLNSMIVKQKRRKLRFG